MLPNEMLVGRRDARPRLETPCLIVDLDALERNIARMAALCRDADIALRPHAKAHKCADIARLQLAAGACGLCVATVGEAEALAAAGISDLLLTSTVGDRGKMERLAALLRRDIRVRIVVDCHEMVEMFASVAAAMNVRFDVLIDVDMGRHRAGIGDAAAAAALAGRISSERDLRLLGIQAYSGHLSHMRDFPDRRHGAAEAAFLITHIRDAVAGFLAAPPVVTGGSTGTLLLDLEAKLFTELQCGSYAFMDTEYQVVDPDGVGGAPFEPSLFLQSSVISNRHAGFVTTDGGDKRLASKYGEPPRIQRGAPVGSSYRSLSDEHGQVQLPPETHVPLGARIECIIPHCDPTVNLFDHLHVVRQDELVDIWPVTARGA